MLTRRLVWVLMLITAATIPTARAAFGAGLRTPDVQGGPNGLLAVPTPRCCVGMTYDSTHQRVVMFGGLDNNGVALGETWLWDGTGWSQQFPTSSPCRRRSTRAAFDALSQQVLLFGGVAGDNCPVQAGKTLGDTWLWNGSNWVQCQATCSTHPGNREGE